MRLRPEHNGTESVPKHKNPQIEVYVQDARSIDRDSFPRHFMAILASRTRNLCPYYAFTTGLGSFAGGMFTPLRFR